MIKCVDVDTHRYYFAAARKGGKDTPKSYVCTWTGLLFFFFFILFSFFSFSFSIDGRTFLPSFEQQLVISIVPMELLRLHCGCIDM